jgi:hypothetical protein
MASGDAHPGGVALFEVPSFSKAVVAGERLPAAIRARAHTESFLRPLRRRAEITARPERVRMRTRNPCVRRRRRLLGWYVRFIKTGHARCRNGGSQQEQEPGVRVSTCHPASVRWSGSAKMGSGLHLPLCKQSGKHTVLSDQLGEQ